MHITCNIFGFALNCQKQPASRANAPSGGEFDIAIG